MKYISVFILILTSSISAKADYASAKKITTFYGSSSIEFAVDSAPSTTCSSWGYHFRFDATTDAGKNMLSILLAAKMADKQVNLWFEPSSVPGTNQENGCSSSTMAIVNAIGIR